MNKKITSIILISVISIMLISSVALNNVDAKKKNKAQIRMVFTDLGNFHGKVKVTLKNEDTGVKLFSETVSLKKDNKETVKFNAKNSQVGDQLSLVAKANLVQGGQGSWGFTVTFQKSMNERVSLDEVDCGGDCG